MLFCIKAIQDYAYSGFGGRGGKHGDILWDNESYAIKQYLKMFAELASATLKLEAERFVWLASTLGRFFDERSGKAERNANELRRADHEVNDIADITKMRIIIKRNIRLLTEIDKLIFKKSHLVKL